MKGAGTGSPGVVRALVWEYYLSGEYSILMEHLEHGKIEAIPRDNYYPILMQMNNDECVL